MTKENILTIRWNNVLSLGLGIPVLAYAFLVVSKSTASELPWFIGMVVFGSVFCVVVELHTTMRFKWRVKQLPTRVITKRKFVILLNIVMISYNLIWWIPIVLAFTNTISYGLGFWSFFAITVFRLGANLYRNNVLDFDRARYFPLRSP